MRKFTLVCVCISIIATALPIIDTDHWWIRIFDFPRAQITVFSIITLVLTIVYFKKDVIRLLLFSTVLLSIIIYQSVLMVRYTPLYPIQAPSASNPDPDNNFSILLSNVKMDNDNYAKFRNLVRSAEPDIILINEVDDKWTKELEEFDAIYPFNIKQPLDNTYGMILYSKFKLNNPEINFLVDDSIPSMYAKVILPSGNEINLHCLHPEPPKPGSSTYERDTEILLVGNRIVEENEPAVVVGDLNDVAWSYTSELFQKRSGMLDPREGRGFFNTYNVFVPLFRYPLDHFFYTQDFNLISLKKLESFGSDHFPIMIHLEYVPK